MPQVEVKVRKLYDPYKEQTLANVDDLIALFEDAKAHPENYDAEVIKRLAEEVTGKRKIADPNKPF